MIDVHARDTAVELARLGVTSETDFEWMSQLRYCWENGDVSVRMINAQVRPRRVLLLFGAVRGVAWTAQLVASVCLGYSCFTSSVTVRP